MNVNLYISSPTLDDEPFLRYDAKVVVEGNLEAQLPQTVVKHYIQRLLHGKEVPFIIEEYFEVTFQEEQGTTRNNTYLSEMSLDDYHRMLRRIARNTDDCMHIFRIWTDAVDTNDVLVCVAESDLAARFIMGLYPPVEIFFP